jgi:hypothetical protein
VRGSVTRAVVPGAVVLVLVALVAIAATGSTATGEDATRRPSDALLDTFFSFVLVAFIPAAAMLIWGLMQRKAIAREVAAGRIPRTGLVTLFTLLLVAAFLSWRFRDARGPEPDEIVDPIFPGREAGRRGQQGEVVNQYEPQFAWIPVLVVVALALTAFAATRIAAHRRRKALAEEDEGAFEALAGLLDDTLDDLRAERDPRRAVIAAYARLERTLAAQRLPRKPAETPEEYLTRILRSLDVDRRSIRRLTDLFTWAKFSAHDVDAGMKEEAIDALSTVRDELRAADERRHAEEAASLETVVERP